MDDIYVLAGIAELLNELGYEEESDRVWAAMSELVALRPLWERARMEAEVPTLAH